MTLPYLDDPGTLDEMTVMELDGLVAKINAFLGREHQSDGTHGAVTATSLTVLGGLREHRRTAALGDWAAVPYAATDFTGSGTMLWTVEAADAQVRRFTVIGHTLHYNLALAATSVGGTVSNELRVALPAGFTIAALSNQLCLRNDAGTGNLVGLATCVAGDRFVRCQLPTGANWTAAINSTSIYATLTIEVTG